MTKNEQHDGPIPEIATFAEELQRIAQGIDDNITFAPVEGRDVKLNRPTRARIKALHELQLGAANVTNEEKRRICREEQWRPEDEEAGHGDHRKPVRVGERIGIDEYIERVSRIIFADFEPAGPDELDESEIRRALDFFLSKRLH